MYRPIRPIGAASRNGSRQPQLCIASVDSRVVSSPAISEPRSRPAAVLAGTTAAYRPRLLAGAYSTRKADAPAYSPEAEKPWTTLIIRSRRGAQIPIVS
jgi:hypothetical protein